MFDDSSAPPSRSQRSYLALGIALFFGAGFLYYSQTAAFAFDEGFHILTAQLIAHGKRPYLDFLFPQTPLNAYWNALLMRIFGESWRVVHAAAALFSAAAVVLTADYVLCRLPSRRWRLAAALAAAMAVGLNVLVVQFGSVGQAYGLCLFLIVAAFRMTVVAVDAGKPLAAGAAGVLAGTAAAASLLTAVAAPVLSLWMLVYNRRGNRWARFGCFVAGAAFPSAPLVWLFVHGPRQTIFNVFDYHAIYRRVQWTTAIPHDLELLAASINSSQALLVGLLAIGGLLFTIFQSGWERERRAEFTLCGWLAAALCVYLSSAHPTFERYYLLALPFAAILAAAGLYWVASCLHPGGRPLGPVLALGLLFSWGLAKTLYDGRDDFAWSDYEKIAAKVAQTRPPHGLLLADESIYFLLRYPPPSGMELQDSHKLELPAALAASLHIVPGSVLTRQVETGLFSSAQTCMDDEKIEALGLPKYFAKKEEIAGCTVFWDRVPPAGAGHVAP